MGRGTRNSATEPARLRTSAGALPVVLTAAIADYADQAIPEEGYPDDAFQVQWLRDPDGAQGMCSTASQHFAKYLTARGLVAYDAGYEIYDVSQCETERGWDPSRRFVRADYEHPANPLLHSDFSPEAFGYHDRTRESEYPEHSATIVETDQGVIMVDWTAAQFGYEQFPLVARWDDGCWRRLRSGDTPRALAA